MECLNGIVGVTETDCGCIVDGLTDEVKTALAASSSGLYLDNLPGGLSLKALDNLETCKTMADMALRAVTNATKMLQGDLIVALNNRYQKAKTNYLGNIGQMSYAGTSSATKPIQGIIIRSREASDAIMTVKRIFIILNGAITTNIKVIKAESGSIVGEEVASYEVTTDANAITTFTIPDGGLDLKLSENGKAMDYYFVYDRLGAFPKDNKIDCNCHKTSRHTLESYVLPLGINLDTVDTLNGTTDSKAHGLVLDVVIKCNNAELVCREYDASEAIATVLAYATWYKAGELLIEDVQKSTEVNRYTQMNREYLWGKRNHFKAQYEGRINYLASSIDISASNCFICKNADMILAPIYATDGQDALNQSNAEYEEIRSQNGRSGPGYFLKP